MPNDSVYLDDAILEDALRRPYYFNGRLLTQEDLTEEQAATWAAQRYLGQTLGAGVACGLEVVADSTASAPGSLVLDVAAGLAVAPDGDVLHLPSALRLRFMPRSQTSDPALVAGEDFTLCSPIASASPVKTGLYLLVVRPVAGKQGRAAVSGLGNETAPCNSKHRTRGVSFRALPLPTSVELASDHPRFRSALALECFGFFEDALRDFVVAPFARPAPLETAVAPSNAEPASGYGKVDALRRLGQLRGCEVPLAVVRMPDVGLPEFVDVWPVRRALTRPALSRHWWPFGASNERRRHEAQAAMLCFQDHVAALLRQSDLSSVVASDHFAFLPGGGFLPVHSGGFDPSVFLGSSEVIRGADFGRLRTWIEESWSCEPIQLQSGGRPPISYLEFSEAPDWVFFLRRRKESYTVNAPAAPPGSSTPASGPDTAPEAPPGSSAPAAPSTAPTLDERREVIVVAPDRWLKRFGKPEIGVTDSRGQALTLLELDPKDAEKLLKKAFFQDTPDPRRRFGEAATSPLARFREAHFYHVKGSVTPIIHVVATRSESTTPVFSDQFQTTPGGVVVVLLS